MPASREKPVSYPALTALAVAVVVVLIPAWIPALHTEPWEWIVVAAQAIVVVALGVYLVRFVGKQRDDYWRERGKDPKHPEA